MRSQRGTTALENVARMHEHVYEYDYEYVENDYECGYLQTTMSVLIAIVRLSKPAPREAA